MKTYLILSLIFFFAACRTSTVEETEPSHDEHRHEHGSEEHADEHTDEGAESLVRIAPEMLRDLRITTAPVEVRAENAGTTVLGELYPDEERYAEVGVPISMQVVENLVAAGDTVSAGQPLARLLSPEVGRARAEAMQAQAEIAVARRAVERKRELAGARVAPSKELQEAEAALVGAEARLAAARAMLSATGAEETAASGNAAELVLRAPVTGTVVERTAVRGQMTEPAHPLFRIADLSRLWLVAHAFERDAVRIKPGAAARVSFSALPGVAFEGPVAFVGQAVDARSRTIPVRVVLDNRDQRLRLGMSATVWLPLDDGDARVTTVPSAALQRLADGWRVFVPRSEGAFESRAVGRGRDLGGEVEILSGLAGGETVVVDGSFLLKAEAEKSRGEGEHHHH